MKGLSVKSAVATVKDGLGYFLLVVISFFEKAMEVVRRPSFQPMLELYCMRAVTVLALAMSVAEHDILDIILCAGVVGIMLLPMEDSFKEIL